MKYTLFQESRIGKRSYQQDRLAHWETRDALLLVVADGMGGHAHGDVAAQVAVDCLGGAFRSEAAVRGFAPITSDEPAALGGTDRAPNQVEQLLSSLGNCLAVGYAANASVAGIEIRDLRIALDGDIDLHTFLGLADGHAGFSAIRVVVHLDTDADEATVAELHRKVAATSPVGQTLSKAIPVEITHQ